MKQLLLALGLILVSATFVLGTPDRVLDIEEDFLGSNAEAFAILRTEHDNLGSYYADRVKRYLDE